MSGQALPVPILARPPATGFRQVSAAEAIALMAHDLVTHSEKMRETQKAFRGLRVREGK